MVRRVVKKGAEKCLNKLTLVWDMCDTTKQLYGHGSCFPSPPRVYKKSKGMSLGQNDWMAETILLYKQSLHLEHSMTKHIYVLCLTIRFSNQNCQHHFLKYPGAKKYDLTSEHS